MNDNLDQLTDAELSECFAVEVAEIVVLPGGLMEHPTMRRFGGERVLCEIPPFATSADAVLPWLMESLGWECCHVIAGIVLKVCTRGALTRSNPLGHIHAESCATTFPRAACIALIRAKRANP